MEKLNKILPSNRISSEDHQLILKAIEKLNAQLSKMGMKISLSQFRAWAYRDFANRVLSQGLDIDIKQNFKLQ